MLSWQEAYRASIKNIADLESALETQFTLSKDFTYPILIPQRILNKIKSEGFDSPIGQQFLPHKIEENDEGVIDPIGDKKNSQGHGIIHRYKNRILFTPTTNCPVLCRYCFRKNELSNQDKIFSQNLRTLQYYLETHKEIEEVILTGGDPLMLPNKRLVDIACVLVKAKIPFLRIHTRTPVILPERIDDGFIGFLNEYRDKFVRLSLAVHCNHKSEIDDDVEMALKKISKTYINCLVQSVLLKNVNNHHETLISLFKKLISCGFTPYYLHHPDRAKGAMHFYLSIEEGRKIYSKIRPHLSGWAIPQYIIDHPSGHGKQFAFNPEQISFSGKLLNSNYDQINYI